MDAKSEKKPFLLLKEKKTPFCFLFIRKRKLTKKRLFFLNCAASYKKIGCFTLKLLLPQIKIPDPNFFLNKLFFRLPHPQIQFWPLIETTIFEDIRNYCRKSVNSSFYWKRYTEKHYDWTLFWWKLTCEEILRHICIWTSTSSYSTNHSWRWNMYFFQFFNIMDLVRFDH